MSVVRGRGAGFTTRTEPGRDAVVAPAQPNEQALERICDGAAPTSASGPASGRR